MTGTNSGTRSWLHWVISAATMVLLIVVARRVDWNHTWAAIRDARAGLVGVAVIANLLTLGFKSVRWWLFLAAAGVEDLGLVSRATFAGAALNNVVVANGGDAARVAAISRRAGVSSAAVLATLAVDRACDLITYVVLFACAALAIPLPGELARWRVPAIVAFIVLMALGTLFVVRATSRQSFDSEHGGTAETTALGRISTYARRMIVTMTSVATTKRMALALGLSLLSWAGQWATFHYAALATRLPITSAESLLALLVVNASFLVRLTPGNVGVFQLLYAVAATSAGLDRDRALAAAFLITAIQYIPVVVIGLPFVPSLARARANEPPLASLSDSGRR